MASVDRFTPLIDTHCHVDLFPDPVALIAEIERSRIYTIAVTNAPSVFDPLSRLVGSARHVRVALGLHPELAAQRSHELPMFERLLPRTRYIGEVGLDYQTAVESQRITQRRVLAKIVALCDSAGGKVVTVHSRRAADDVVDAFGANFNGRYILHWYSGGIRTLRRALANGAYASINPAMAVSRSGRTLIAEIPRDRVLTETDGPFVMLGPTGKGTPASPVDSVRGVEAVARLWGVSAEEARAIIFGNFTALLRAP